MGTRLALKKIHGNHSKPASHRNGSLPHLQKKNQLPFKRQVYEEKKEVSMRFIIAAILMVQG